MKALTARLKLVIESEIKGRGRYAQLAARSSVPAETWRSWWTRGGTPNGALLEAAAKLWPQYAFWLATGSTDSSCGHIKPCQAEVCGSRSETLTECSQAYFLQLLSFPRDELADKHVQAGVARASLRVLFDLRAEEIASNLRRSHLD